MDKELWVKRGENSGKKNTGRGIGISKISEEADSYEEA